MPFLRRRARSYRVAARALLVPAIVVSATAVRVAPAGTSAAEAASIGHGTITVLHVPSEDHDVPVRDVWVYRPGVPDSRTLPVVYFLHGLPGAASDLFAHGGAAVLDRMFGSGTPPFVVACLTGTGHAHVDTEWADSVDGRDRLETYLFSRVIPAVEGRNRRDARHRFVAGFSMGGYGAVNLALRHQSAFAGAASFAGYFHIDDPDDVFGRNPAVEAANDPEDLVHTDKRVQFWLGDGASDDEPVVEGESQRFAKLAGPLVAPGDLVIAPGTHSWSFVLAHLPDLGRFVAQLSR